MAVVAVRFYTGYYKAGNPAFCSLLPNKIVSFYKKFILVDGL